MSDAKASGGGVVQRFDDDRLFADEGRWVLHSDHAEVVAALEAEVADRRAQMAALWKYVQSVGPWSPSNDMEWADEVICGIGQLVQRAEAAEARIARVEADASATVTALLGLLKTWALFSDDVEDVSHNGKPLLDVTAEVLGAERAFDIRAAIGGEG